ncbi:MAG: hypothetical protein GF346_05145 [Candidatus Eisenbacteria bacterium]|nr:hypothetical protein [Candidatus Latescibacterota bacterium]MBD3301812.1 hypothetical protein [Candidatus Eisenbacteria bacterium]
MNRLMVRNRLAPGNRSAREGGPGGRGGRPPMEAIPRGSVPQRTEILVLGFGTSVAMWAIGYVSRMPPAWVPSWLLLLLLVGVLFTGGFLAGRLTGRGWKAGMMTGALAAVLNLLILGSLLTAQDQPNRIVPSALWWIPGSLLVAMLAGAGGAALGAAGRPVPRVNWTSWFVRVDLAATFLLLIVGGLVTSHRAGLAVVDWPNSFGYNMFLYPLSRMTGGIYYEHAHRLFGSLVGLTTLVLVLHLHRADPRVWLRRLALIAFVTVVIQGLLGGLRVTGTFTLSQSPDAMSPNLALAVVHGVLAQLFFAMLVAIAVFTSSAWVGAEPPAERTAASTDRSVSVLLVAVLLIQLILGAIQRHFLGGLLVHITMAVLVFLIGLAAGLRAWGLYPDRPALRTVGKGLVFAVVLQVALGIGALIGRGLEQEAAAIPTISILLRTAHQAMGAALLALATMLVLWTRREIAPAD